MQIILAALPILILLILIIGFQSGGEKAGPIALVICTFIAYFFFGLNFQVLQVILGKAGALILFVLLMVWSAMLLFQTISATGGIFSLANALHATIKDTGFLWILLAWCFSAFLEGIAGYGTPIAIVAPILVFLGVPPVTAVIAVAIGHSWEVTFGNMGLVIQTLSAVSQMPIKQLVFPASIIMGVICILCGISVTLFLKQRKQIPWVIGIGLIMGLVQGLLANFDLITLSGFLGAVTGILTGFILKKEKRSIPLEQQEKKKVAAVVSVYLFLSIILVIIFWPGPIRAAFEKIAFIPMFPETITDTGFRIPAGNGQILRPLVHPGIIMLCVTLIAIPVLYRIKMLENAAIHTIAHKTWRITAPTSIAIMATIMIAVMMEHTGMTQILAEGLAKAFGRFYPNVAAWVGILGAFATGSNNSSNILFAEMQKQIALLLQLSPAWLVAAQTAGGSLGSMTAPAKITLGVTSAGIPGKEGEVLKRTIPVGLSIGLIIGFLIFIFLLV